MFVALSVSANVWGADYELVTSTPSDWSGEYLIVAGTSALSGGTSSWGSTTAVTVSNNKISTTANISVTISKGGTSGTYYIYMNSNSKYLKEVTSNIFATADVSSTDTEWKISLSNGNAQIECASSTARYLRLNGTSGYRCYTSATGTLPKLYKKAASYTITAQSNNTNYGTVSLSGTTITATPKTGYRVSTTTPYTISPSNSAKVTQNGNTFTVTPSANTTITINFEALPKYTVTLKDDNSTLTQITAGGSVTLPPRDGCEGYTFAGWTKTWTEEQEEWTTTAPTIISAGSYTPTANESLYPVYTKTESGGSEPIAYSAGDEGDFVIASYNTSNSKWYAIPETPTLSSSKIAGVEITVSQTAGDVNYVSTANAEGYTWTIADATNGQTISDGTQYIYHSNGGASGTNLAYGTSTSYTWKIEKENNGLTFKGMNGSTTNSRGLLFNGSVFGGYALSNEDQSGYYRIQVLPIGGGSTTSYISVPECSTQPSYFVTIADNIENGEVTANLTSATAGTEIELTATPTNGYQFSSWIVTKDGGGAVEVTNNKFTMPASNVTVSATFTQLPKLTTPTNLSVSNISCSNATLTWSVVAGASKYELRLTNTSTSNTTTSYPTTNSAYLTLAAGTTYSWTVQAIGDGLTYNSSDITEGEDFTSHYTITYNVDGGTTVEDGCGTTLPDPLPTTTKTGYTFAGWYTDSEFNTSATAGAAITQNTTLYAKWTANTYIITLDANGGKFVKDGNESETIEIQYVYGTYANYDQAKLISDYLAEEGIKLSREGYQLNEMWQSNGSAWKRVFTAINRTIQAQWSKLYSITLSENGTTTELDAQTSTSYTLPTGLSAGSCQDDTKELVGWSTVAIPNPGDKPTSKFYELGETVTLTEDQTTFYAVFATPGEGGDDIPLISFLGGGQSNLLAIDGISASGLGSDYAEGNAPYRVKLDDTDDYILYTNSSGSKITKLYIKVKMIGGGNTSKITVQTSDNNSDYADIDEWSIEGNQGNVVEVLLTVNSSSKYIRLYFDKGSNVGLGTLIFYTSSISYSDYSTTCVKLPDPVLSFATEPANPIVFTDAVCGGNSSKQSVTVVGENLRDVVNVSVTGPYKIARTASTALKDFTTSLTLDKTAAGAIHSNYQTVYIISTPPTQSTDATTGTLTFTTTKGNTLTVNLSTPTVTCTQYTLTLVDRGVSTEQPTKYYSGETIDEAPADPEGVCTDPIHYVFDGWAEATVAAGSTTYTKVTFPYTVEGNTKFYAVYRYVEDGGADSGDYVKVTENLDDYSGDYLFVYETGNVAFDGGRNNVDDELDATSNTIEVTINDNTIASNATTDAAKFTIAKVDDGYSIQSASGYYIGWSTADKNGLNANSKYSANYYLNTISNSIISGVKGTLKYNKTSGQERFRYYQSGQETIALYRKAASYLYTTSPVCGPHLAITEGKDIYVTGGNAGGTRDLVIAQQKVSYKATRLKTSNGLDDGTAPDVKVATNGITVGGVVTSDVKVTIDQTKEQQTDGTYTITGTITVQYQPSANNKQEDIQVQLAVDYNAEARDNFTVHARSLPSEFVIVAKSGDKWYALNADMSGDDAELANGQVTLDNDANPTKATYAPCNAIYTFEAMPQGAEDRISVRFIGQDNKYLWAASGTNTGIQNNSTNPAADALAYNWKLYTEDNITYRFGNANSNRQLTLSGEKFGMYASGVQDIRILPYEAKCLYNYAPTNLKVSVLKGSYVTLTWDAVAGATKYQYSTDATNWNDAGTEPTVTINGLTGDTEYTYYIRAYHEDAGVSQECIDYAEITFTTANCDDVPTNITYTADLNSITVSWTASAQTATIKLYSDENGEHAIFIQNETTSPWKISTLSKNTTYYLQIFSNGTCASPIIPVKTEDVEVDIVEWYPQGIIVDINTDETVGVTLENEVSYGSGIGTEATELFFSKYYEASYNVKLVAIYNGTKNIIDLTDYTIQYGKTSWESNYITLKDFGATKGQIQPGEEIILYSMQDDSEDDDIMDCVHEDFPDGNWVRVTSSNNDGKGTLSFGGDKTIILCKTEYDDEEDEYYDNIIDVIGALKDDPNEGILPTNENTEKPSWGDKEGWVCETGLSIADDSQIGISTNRCLLIRNNTVTSGDNAVVSNMNDFSTLCTEWKGAHVPDDVADNGVQASCDNFADVGTFDYSDYYTKYESMGAGTTFEENDRNLDGTVTIPITDLYKHACSNIRVKLTNINSEVLSDREYKVPIMITTTQGTDGEAFIALQQNLATKEVDGEGNVTATHPLSLEEVREICKTCDVVVRNNAILTKAADDAANDHPEVHDIYVYENSSLIVPNGTNYTINNLSLRRKEDAVASVSAYPDALKLPESAAAPISLDFRLSAENWHWFTLPYDCNINEVTWADGTPTQYNTDWYLMTYDGEKRAATQAGGCWKAYTGTTIKAGEGFILAINGNINNPAHTYELRFPMSKEVLAAEGTDKTVDVRAWGVETDIRPNHKGWNLVGNPYLAYYQRNSITNFEGLRLGQLTGPDPQTGYWEQTGNVPYVVVPVGAGWIAYEQVLASETDLLPFTAYFVQVGNDETHNSAQDLKVAFDHTKLQLSATPMPASIIQRSATEDEEPIIVGVSLTNAKGESDKTSLIIDDQYTDEYEMHADFFKWFGDYYTYYTKPVLYTVGADQGKRAFNALNEELATQPVALGMYAAQAGEYTFTLDLRSDLSHVEEIWLHDATENIYTNLLQDSYTFSTGKINGEGRFFLSVKMKPQQEPDPDPEPTPDPTPDSDPETSLDDIVANRVFATVKDNVIYISGLLSDAQLWIYDAAGRLMHYDQTKYYQHTYLVPQGGAYFVRVQGTMQTQTIKVVVK